MPLTLYRCVPLLICSTTSSVLPGPQQRRRARRRSRLAAVLLLPLCGGVAASSCSGSPQRLSERETLQYKLQLARDRRREISPAKVDKLLYHPARTRPDIDRAFDDLAREHAAEVARDNAEHARLLEEERKARADEAAAEADANAPGVKDASGGDTRDDGPAPGSDASRRGES